MSQRYLLILLSPQTEAMDRMMYAVMAEAGIMREDVGVVYLLNGEQPDGAYGRPTTSQLQRTRAAFRLAVEGSAPQCIIPVGPEAFQALTGLKWPIDEARGYVILPEHCKPSLEKAHVEVGAYKTGAKKGLPKFAWKTYSAPPPLPLEWSSGLELGVTKPTRRCGYIVPSISFKQYVTQRRRQVTALMAAFENAVAYGRGDKVDVLTSWRESTEGTFVRPYQRPLAFDLEAPVGSTSIERFSVATPDAMVDTMFVASLPWGEKEKQYLVDALDASSVNVAHNIQYDVPVLMANGITVPEPWFDTMIAASLLEPDLPKGLGKVLPIYLLTHPHKHLSEERGYNDPEYSAKDAWTELRLYEEQVLALKDWGMYELFTERIMRSVPALVDLKVRGLAVNAGRAEAWCDKLRDEQRGLLHWWFGHFPDVVPSSNKDVTTLLYKTWGLPVQRSKHDGWTADELALRTLMGIEPKYEEPIKKLLALRGVQKQLQTYGKALLGNARVYPSYLPRGKDSDDANKGLPGTGRLASSGPNIQNQTDEAREVFECDDLDWVFLAGDYSQAELRVMAAHSGDAALQAALDTGDLHARTMELLGLSGADGRTLAKNAMYGTSYGAGPKRLVDTLRGQGVYTTIGAMKDLQKALARAYPDWWSYLQEVAALGQAQGFLRNSFSRVRRFTAPEQDVPAMKDFIPQSEVGDIGWSTYRDVSDGAAALGGRLSMLVHDEVVIQVPASRLREGASLLRDVMGREFSEIAPGFRLPINLKMGPQWGPSMVKEEKW